MIKKIIKNVKTSAELIHIKLIEEEYMIKFFKMSKNTRSIEDVFVKTKFKLFNKSFYDVFNNCFLLDLHACRVFKTNKHNVKTHFANFIVKNKIRKIRINKDEIYKIRVDDDY